MILLDKKKKEFLLSWLTGICFLLELQSQESREPEKSLSNKEHHPSEKNSVSEPVEGQLIDIGGVKVHEEVIGHESMTDTTDTIDLNSFIKNEDKSNNLNDATAACMDGTSNSAADSGAEKREQQYEEGSILEFDKSFTISPDDFESNWTKLETRWVLSLKSALIFFLQVISCWAVLIT